MGRTSNNKQGKFNSKVREKIEELMKMNDIKSKELAADLKINPSTFNNYLSGTNIPSGLIASIAEYFQVTTDYLLGLTLSSGGSTGLTDICVETGLSEKAVEAIMDEGMDRAILSELLSSGIMKELVQTFAKYKKTVCNYVENYCLNQAYNYVSSALLEELNKRDITFQWGDERTVYGIVEAKQYSHIWDENISINDLTLSYLYHLFSLANYLPEDDESDNRQISLEENRYILGFKIIELLRQYGDLSYQSMSLKTLSTFISQAIESSVNCEPVIENYDAVSPYVGKIPFKKFYQECSDKI